MTNLLQNCKKSLHRPAADAEEQAADEEIAAHASGLLAIALGEAAHCEEAVRSGFVGHLISQAGPTDMP